MEPYIILLLNSQSNIKNSVFNECNVAISGLECNLSFGNKYSVRFRVGYFNGLWGYGISASTTLWSFACPLMTIDFVHPNIDVCFSKMWGELKSRTNDEKFPKLVNKYHAKWNKLSKDEKMKLFTFKDDFYA